MDKKKRNELLADESKWVNFNEVRPQDEQPCFIWGGNGNHVFVHYNAKIDNFEKFGANGVEPIQYKITKYLPLPKIGFDSSRKYTK